MFGRSRSVRPVVARLRRLLLAVAQAYRDDGERVIGITLGGQAAQQLSEELGVPIQTLASWRLVRKGLRAGDIVLVDEAGMVGTHELAVLLHRAHASNAKVVLVGDPKQLAAIGAGDALRGLEAAHPVSYLHDNYR